MKRTREVAGVVALALVVLGSMPCLGDVPGLEVRIVAADEPWAEGPRVVCQSDVSKDDLKMPAPEGPERAAAK